MGTNCAILFRLLGDFDLVEEAVQEAFVAAANQWETSRILNFSRVWIIRTV
jgi:RNA polymerase sigma-70 factor, ECF subfamily